MEPMFDGGGSWTIAAILAVAVTLLIAIGLRVIHAITRDPDEDPDHWRSHRR